MANLEVNANLFKVIIEARADCKELRKCLFIACP